MHLFVPRDLPTHAQPDYVHRRIAPACGRIGTSVHRSDKEQTRQLGIDRAGYIIPPPRPDDPLPRCWCASVLDAFGHQQRKILEPVRRRQRPTPETLVLGGEIYATNQPRQVPGPAARERSLTAVSGSAVHGPSLFKPSGRSWHQNSSAYGSPYARHRDTGLKLLCRSARRENIERPSTACPRGRFRERVLGHRSAGGNASMKELSARKIE